MEEMRIALADAGMTVPEMCDELQMGWQHIVRNLGRVSEYPAVYRKIELFLKRPVFTTLETFLEAQHLAQSLEGFDSYLASVPELRAKVTTLGLKLPVGRYPSQGRRQEMIQALREHVKGQKDLNRSNPKNRTKKPKPNQ